jgi:hypothetical protein
VNRALDSDAEKDEAIELWQKALGKEWFPESVEESMSARYVTPKGHILQTPRPDSASVEIPSHRFYGEED